MFMAEDLRLSSDSSFHYDACAGGAVSRGRFVGAAAGEPQTVVDQ